MFTDIIGYTALMSKDEQKALKTLQKNQEPQQVQIQYSPLRKASNHKLLAFFIFPLDSFATIMHEFLLEST